MVTTPPTSNLDLNSSPLGGRVNDDNGIPHPHKRTYLQFSLPSEEAVPQAAWDPRKKVKTVYTTVGLCGMTRTRTNDSIQVSARKSREIEDLHSLRMLELSRASRRAFFAQVQYCRLRLQEIEVMRTIAVDECEEAEARLKRADSQIGEIRHLLHANGTALGDSGIVLLGMEHDDDDNESSSKERNHKSPTPSDYDHDI